MLEFIHLRNVGPAPEMSLEFGPRINIITGDNGLGKSFLLDVAWWSLTRKWPRDLNDNLTSGYPAQPINTREAATIEFGIKGKSSHVKYKSTYVPSDQAWVGKAGRPWNPGLVVYALADGGFAVWDPASNYWKPKGKTDVHERLPAYVLSARDVWDGLSSNIDRNTIKVCNGLIADWAYWTLEDKDSVKILSELLWTLSNTSGTDGLTLGKSFARLSLDDDRYIPTVRMGYDHEVPILHTSLGVRRTAALAYMLLWAWLHNIRAAAKINEEPSNRLVVLIDEVEAHLHPRWQRSIVPATLKVIDALAGKDPNRSIQLIASTHSPLVLASLEPIFDRDRDAWFDIDLEEHDVVLTKRDYVRQGEISHWLVSEAFDLREPRSIEGEKAVQAALTLLDSETPRLSEVEAVDRQLQLACLPDDDPFLVRWCYFVDQARKGALTQTP